MKHLQRRRHYNYIGTEMVPLTILDLMRDNYSSALMQLYHA